MSTSRQQESAKALGTGARAAVVNRTHRVVREQALALQEQRKRSRSLLVPVALCSTLVLLTCYGAWSLLESYDLTANGVLEGSYQTLIFLAWSLPATILVVGLVWMQRVRARVHGDQ